MNDLKFTTAGEYMSSSSINSLILHLAQQAGLKSSIESDVSPAEKKFALLILGECCQYLNNEAERLYGLSEKEEDPIFQSNFEIGAEKCYDNIQGLKDHFGVGE